LFPPPGEFFLTSTVNTSLSSDLRLQVTSSRIGSLTYSCSSKTPILTWSFINLRGSRTWVNSWICLSMNQTTESSVSFCFSVKRDQNPPLPHKVGLCSTYNSAWWSEHTRVNAGSHLFLFQSKLCKSTDTIAFPDFPIFSIYSEAGMIFLEYKLNHVTPMFYEGGSKSFTFNQNSSICTWDPSSIGPCTHPHIIRHFLFFSFFFLFF
jgi:hypothetical protein